MTFTPTELLPLIAAGSQVLVRDEEWLVRQVVHTPADGLMVKCLGTSTLVRDTESTFFTNLDEIQPLLPSDTRLIHDGSPSFRTSRLYLEAVIRKTPMPVTEKGLVVADRQLLEPLEYQRRAAHKALTSLRPRLLIADAVGLGKTLEVGLILSELIRRGRGDRILVVTPRHILEQFQHELWTRFAIPLVRLDSEGIQRVRQKIPANRNPFTFYKRAIISIDTLKNVGRYRHHLEGIRWDAVVIDECHNLVNRGTLNNQLARVLAPRTEALLLTSATPHNGDPESFAELIRLLDPTAIVDPNDIKASDIEHLYVRRHKGHDEVAPEVGSKWADRLPPKPVVVDCSPPEEDLFTELAEVWTHPTTGQAPVSGAGRSLFPWTLFKAALSSHKALAQTLAARRRTIANEAEKHDAQLSPERTKEDEALASLEERCAAIGDADSSKLQALIDNLKEIGVKKGRGAPRVVVFSERIATLDWLAEQVPPALGLNPKNVRVLHGGMADVKQMDVIEEFGLADSDVRLLLTGDMASEGVNLHRECHHLIHYDLPWSLITIEQRNGRIDRYGQESPPDIRALIQTPTRGDLTGDVRILSRLLEREHQAHVALGDSGSLLGLHTAEAEEDRVLRALRDREDPDTVVPEKPKKDFDILALLSGNTGLEPAPAARRPSLFESDHQFAGEALRSAFEDPIREFDIRYEEQDPTFLSMVPPRDLVKRLDALPQTYLREQGVAERLRLSANPEIAQNSLDRARAATDSMWPDVGYLSPLHPFVSWLTDKVLVRVGRNEAPIVRADVRDPTFCVQGVLSNGRGQPQLVEWMAVRPVLGGWEIDDLFRALDAASVKPGMTNPGGEFDSTQLQALVPQAVEQAVAELDRRRQLHDAELDQALAAPAERLEDWVRGSNQLAMGFDNEQRRFAKEKQVGEVRRDTEELIDSLRTQGQPLVRVLAVLVGRDA